MARQCRIAIFTSATLFGEWALIRSWGRIGSTGQKLEQWFTSLNEAQVTLEKLKQAKIKRGYQIPMLDI